MKNNQGQWNLGWDRLKIITKESLITELVNHLHIYRGLVRRERKDLEDEWLQIVIFLTKAQVGEERKMSTGI